MGKVNPISEKLLIWRKPNRPSPPDMKFPKSLTKRYLYIASVAMLMAFCTTGWLHGRATHDVHYNHAQHPQATLTGEGGTVTDLLTAPGEPKAERKLVKRVLFIGDSMTGWMSERLNAYGELNGFEVSTVVWDGSTITKWANPTRLKQIIAKEKPDAIFISLGMNELLERNPSRYDESVNKILSSFGSIPYVWIGPPSWPGKGKGEKLNAWLEQKLGAEHYFVSSDLTLARQSASNPHPSRAGITAWMDRVAQWLPESGSGVEFESLNVPAKSKMSRGKSFTYRKMKENL